ncbi:hypothetical protein OH77DRAFT_1463767 [Trametes cingulata]|nr:hypothetical protein OH77DRAFT_1463767 [Trametes cingulata]
MSSESEALSQPQEETPSNLDLNPEPQEDSTGVTRDKELWFEDGTIVLLAPAGADDATSLVAFRVYTGILASASPVFRDLFAVAQPGDGEFFDDCPAVHLAETAGALRSFLTALLGPSCALATTKRNNRVLGHTVSFAWLADVARTAHKYQADQLADAAIGRIAELFLPREARLWINFAGSWTEQITIGRLLYGIEFRSEDAIEAVNLARLFDRPLMLPLALYMCCLLEPSSLRNGVKRKDGVLERLTDDDFARCMRAIPSMAKESYAHMQRTLEWAGEGLFKECTQPYKCKLAAKEAATSDLSEQTTIHHLFVRADQRVVLAGSGLIRYGPAHSLKWACGPCLVFRLKRSTDLCCGAWRKLPKWFFNEGIEGWC